MATLFTPLHARYSRRSGVATMLRTTPPPDGISSLQTSSLPFAGSMAATTVLKEDQAKGATAVASAQFTSFADPVQSFSASASRTSFSAADDLHAASAHEKPASRPQASSARLPDFFEPISTPEDSASPAPKPPVTLSDDPVLADLERAEMEAALAETQTTEAQKPDAAPAKAAPGHADTPSDASVFSSYQKSRQKPRGAFVAVMVLVIVAGGFYGAWMYQPGFRTLAQPQVDRVLALVGMALPPTQAQQPQRPVPQPAPTPAPVVAATPSAADPGTQSTASEPATTTAVPSTSSSPAQTTAAPTSAPQTATVAPAALQPPTTAPPAVTRIDVSKTVASKPAEVKKDAKKPELKKTELAATPDAPLPGENSAIILSSKGAEKRLAHSVPPKYPAEGGADGTVVLKEVVDEDGKVQGVRLVEGNAALATAAIQAVKQWRYRPYVRDGKAQSFQTVVIVDFQKP